MVICLKECVHLAASMPVFAVGLVAGAISVSRLLICRGARTQDAGGDVMLGLTSMSMAWRVCQLRYGGLVGCLLLYRISKGRFNSQKLKNKYCGHRGEAAVIYW